ncbi:hypothetical protein AB4J90_08385 [Geobacillus thermodenitrificans]|jgi:hypothetical protein|nr:MULTISPECIES: hypothetical protein [Geobacillus]MED3717807.1 hypothetical protein [Geobacillus thermodenitrificans]MED4918574.1 hypothetical protein [Geobacillus thermodenitrificans]
MLMKLSWKNWIKQTTSALHEWMQRESHSFAELAELIRHHPDTVQSERTWLGLTYRFYSLTLNDMALKMETKVTRTGSEHILLLSLHTPRGKGAVYRCYDETCNLDDTIVTPPLSEKTAPI